MRYLTICMVALLCMVMVMTGCGEKASGPETAAAKEGVKKGKMEGTVNWQAKADEFLKNYLDKYAKIEYKQNISYWNAANSGKKEDFDASAAARLELRELLSDKKSYQTILDLLVHKEHLEPITQRALSIAELAFKGNQLPPEMLKKLVDSETAIEEAFNTFRGEIDGKKYTNNDLLEMLKKETDSAKRQKIWDAMKQVGNVVGPKLVALAKVRNEAAKLLNYSDFWDMRIRLQEHEPENIVSIFADLEKMTTETFKKMKGEMDGELAKRFKVKPEEMMPWHYDNPFFQAAPPSDKIDLDEFYKDKKKEDIIVIAQKFLSDIGLDTESIVKNSDRRHTEIQRPQILRRILQNQNLQTRHDLPLARIRPKSHRRNPDTQILCRRIEVS